MNHLIEKYGDPHLHTGVSPLPVNEAEYQQCPGSCYYGCEWPEQKALADSIDNPNPPQIVAINNNPDPKKRYAVIPSEPADIGVGCMNLNCMCANCHGDCKCPKTCPSTDQKLMFDKEVAEHFSVGGFALMDNTVLYLLVGLALFALWYYFTKQQGMY
jgi:hypothetical protein